MIFVILVLLTSATSPLLGRQSIHLTSQIGRISLKGLCSGEPYVGVVLQIQQGRYVFGYGQGIGGYTRFRDVQNELSDCHSVGSQNMCQLCEAETKSHSAVVLCVFHSMSSFSSPWIWFSISPILCCWRSMRSCDCRYTLLPLDESWSADTQLIWSSSGEDNMFYGEKKQQYNSEAHIIRSHTRGLESNKACILCVRSGNRLVFWVKRCV